MGWGVIEGLRVAPLFFSMLNITMLVITIVVGIIVGAVVLTQLTPIASDMAKCNSDDTVGAVTITDGTANGSTDQTVTVNVASLTDNYKEGGNLRLTLNFAGNVPASPTVSLSGAPSTYSATATSDTTNNRIYVDVSYNGSDSDGFNVSVTNAQSNLSSVSGTITTNATGLAKTMQDSCWIFVNFGGVIIIVGAIIGIVAYFRFFGA